MRFAFDDDQLAFRDAVRDLLSKECTPEHVRQPDRRVWDALAEMGVTTLLVAEDLGGMGLDERWLVLLLEEAGYAGLPHPIVETAAVVNPMLSGAIDPAAELTTDLGGPLVPWAADADAVLLGRPLRLARSPQVDAVDTVDPLRRAARVTGEGDPVDGDADLAFDRGAWGTAAYLVGLGRRMLDLTVSYVTERQQFGVPIGSFQAVKHHLADSALQLAFARPAVHRAAWSLATSSPDARRDVSMAKAMASDAAELAGRKALQCHGAIGYTIEHDLHLFLKRSWALERSWGDAAFHRDRVGAAIGV